MPWETRQSKVTGADRKIWTDTDRSVDGFEVRLEAEKYPDCPLLDTSVQVAGEFCITYPMKEKFLADLAKLVGKYRI